jgi:hypothetical protein
MTDLLQDLSARLKGLAGQWTQYTVIGSFVLYVLGYLVLRFHLTAMGIATDPISLVVAYVAWRLWRLLPPRVGAFFASPTFGIVFSLVMIQAVMRQCFLIGNLLLVNDLSGVPPWLASLLLDDTYMLLFFSAIVAACAVPLGILVAWRGRGLSPVRRGVLGFLAVVQVLLLAVNYGYLVVDKTLPRVAALGEEPLRDGQEGWLVWEGESVTFLVRDAASRRRALVTLPKAKIARMEVVGFDPILRRLFGSGAGPR